ncbi:FAD/NAD-binding domain-containing protein [Rickenella mellea]|uniref:FAD/NAD-binding domain-containing protein n=1 Tax=Rickenella mellea TaxID=50990 RepID=A0A4Y7Q5R2_9AGAM|nr:FAD/NAD-binding domain-containing protein [Rickenella mellea]
MKTPAKPIRVAIVGAGSAGMAAAFALTNHPEKFKVTVFDKQDVCGGVATSFPIDAEKFGAHFINDGVQGGSPQFFNTYKFFEKIGFTSTDVGMQISFGKGPETFWTNVFPSELVAKHAKDIERFGRVLKVIKVLEPVFAVMSVQAMLRLFRFPTEFGDRLIYPLIALFMGTGNQTPHVSSAILERLFLDPSMSLFTYSPSSLLAEIPTMRAFPSLRDVYAAWQVHISEHRACVRLRTEVTQIITRRKGKVVLRYRNVDQSAGDIGGVQNGAEETEEEFDELVLAADADSCLKMLGKQASWKERRILGNVKYFWDVSITHWDQDYMKKYYELGFRDELMARARKENQESVEIAQTKFQPLYFIHMYEHDPRSIEMSFDLTNYQPQFKQDTHLAGPDTSSASGKSVSDDSGPALTSETSPPHVYQTIFLNRDISDQWTREDIDPSKVLLEKWWKQQGHNWTHYLGTVPWLWTINGRHQTHYAGGWGLVNMHEVGITSGFAAAYQLGADYPFNEDDDARRLFTLVLGLMHLTRMRKKDRRGFFA